jgi:hypothetical protein
MVKNIKRLSMNYIRQGLYVTAALFLLTLLVMQVWFLDLLTPIIVSVAFTLVVCITIGMIWRYVALNSPDSLPTFFTAVSGFRLLLALAVMFVYYLLDHNDTMLTFFLVFMVFYVASLAHHTIFFARVSNSSDR